MNGAKLGTGKPRHCGSRVDPRFIYWCHPKLVCQVEYGEFTTDGKLRYPLYLRPRVDKDPEDCTLSDAPGWPESQFIPV